MMDPKNVGTQGTELRDSIVKTRRELHQHPELAFEEFWTAAYVADYLERQGIEVQRGIGGTGVLGILRTPEPGPTVLLRSQMDGLALPESDERPYHSLRPDRNHACGHDVNMALVLGSASILAARRKELVGQVAFVFQPAEEPQTGAKRMIDDGLFERMRPDFVLAHHPMDNLEVGKVVAQVGPIWGSVDVLKLTITGERPLLDAPHGGTDAMLIAGQVITSLYAMAHRENPLQEPVVLRASSIHGPIPGAPQPEVEIMLRVTTYNSTVQEALCRRIDEVSAGIVRAMHGSYRLENTHSLPPIINHPIPSLALIDAAKGAFGEENVVQNWRNTFPEDFAHFMAVAPGAVFGIGTRNSAEGVTGRFHESDYDIDEGCLVPGVEVMSRATVSLLNQKLI